MPDSSDWRQLLCCCQSDFFICAKGCRLIGIPLKGVSDDSRNLFILAAALPLTTFPHSIFNLFQKNRMEERHMKNWKKDRNFRKYKNDDGSYTYVISVDGENVEVSAEIYAAYAEGGYKMENMEFAIKCDRYLQDANGKAVKDEYGNYIMLPEREVSLEKLVEEDWDFPSSTLSPEDTLIAAEYSEVGELRRCLSLLVEDEQALIKSLFFEGMTESVYAAVIGIKQQNVNKRKKRIIKNLKSFWGEGC